MKKVNDSIALKRGQRQHGFTLIELMVIIAILGTLSAIAIPNILSYRDNARLKAGANDLLALFRKAQVTAVKRHFDTVIDFNTAGKAIVTLDDGASTPVEEYLVPIGCSMPIAKINFTGKKTGFTPRGLPIGTFGAVEILSTNANSKAQYKVALSIAGHTKLEVSTDGGSTWQ